MRIWNVIFFAFFSLFLAGCLESSPNTSSENKSDEEPTYSNNTDPTLDGMMFVFAENSQAILGTKDSSARANERPQMTVDFDYSFSIGKHEVTCEEFNAYSKMQMECAGDSLPVTNVNYYDAILFANERSKAEGFDTAYVYSSALFDADHRCLSLGNLSFRADVEAYRLPSEAEWVLVASQNWNPSLGWNSDNSKYKIHKVCTADTSASVCDMAGNVSEWVNDWLGKFKDTTLSNFAGAPDGGNLGERIIKGGSYRDAPSSMTLYSRGDVYTVTSSTAAEYVGFRLAIGKISSPTWMSSTGNVSSSVITSLASAGEIRSYTGSYQSKLAFRNGETGNLVYIDYSNAIISAVEIADTIDSYHPDISPDGNRVAFCTKPEGISGTSELYVRNLDETGSSLVKLDVESAAIPRWAVLASGDTVIRYVDDAGNNTDDATFQSHALWQVPFSNGKFGTPEKLLAGNYHDGYDAGSEFAVSGSRLLRAYRNGKDTVWYGGEQACNASLANDGSKRTLFLDFGGSIGQSFAETSYNAHKALLIADSTGNLTQVISAPDGYTFDHTEWISGSTSNVAIASLTNDAGAHQKIAVVGLSRAKVFEIVEGEDLWHPCLWAKKTEKISESLNSDSAGVYFTSAGGEVDVILRYKMELLWEYRNTANVLILGSSRSNAGIAPKELDSAYFAINASNVPNSLYETRYLFENYALNHMPNLKYLVVSLDIDMWWKKKTDEIENYFYKTYKKSPGFVYDENHEFWKSGYPAGLAERTENSPGNSIYREWLIPTRGFKNEECHGWEEEPSIDRSVTWYEENPALFQANVDELKEILTLASEKNITVVGVIFPMSPGFAQTESFGRYGLSRSKAPELIDSLQSLSKTYTNFVLMDENKMGNHDYTDAAALNRDHLCTAGAIQMTGRLNSLLDSLEQIGPSTL